MINEVLNLLWRKQAEDEYLYENSYSKLIIYFKE